MDRWKERDRRVTRLSWLQVTWNQVQGLTRVGSQLWRTLLGSDRLRRSVYSASPSEFPQAPRDDKHDVRARVTHNTPSQLLNLPPPSMPDNDNMIWYDMIPPPSPSTRVPLPLPLPLLCAAKYPFTQINGRTYTQNPIYLLIYFYFPPFHLNQSLHFIYTTTIQFNILPTPTLYLTPLCFTPFLLVHSFSPNHSSNLSKYSPSYSFFWGSLNWCGQVVLVPTAKCCLLLIKYIFGGFGNITRSQLIYMLKWNLTFAPSNKRNRFFVSLGGKVKTALYFIFIACACENIAPVYMIISAGKLIKKIVLDKKILYSCIVVIIFLWRTKSSGREN